MYLMSDKIQNYQNNQNTHDYVMTMLWLYLDFVLTDLDDFKSKDNFKQKRECNSAQFNLYWFFFHVGAHCAPPPFSRSSLENSMKIFGFTLP